MKAKRSRGENVSNEKKYSTQNIKSSLDEGVFNYKKVKFTVKNGVKRTVSSTVWVQFSQIYEVENNNDVSDWFICLLCNELVKNIHGGTTTLFRRHMKRCVPKSDGQKTHDEFLPINPQEKAKISEKYTEQVNETAVRFVCNDLRPIWAVELAGMHNYLSTAIELGRAYPHLPKESLMATLPKRTTVRRMIERKVVNVKQMLTDKLREAINTCGGFSCTFDLWTDNFRQKCYLAGTAHLNRVGDKAIIHERFVIAMIEVEEEQKTKVVVENKMFESLQEFQISSEETKTKVNIVTDRGAQFKAMDSIKRANCFAHMLNNVVKAMCLEPSVKQIIEDSSKLVKYIKRSGLNFHHNISLKSYCETRWNTVFIMLESILNCYHTVFTALENRQNSGKREHRQCIQRIECIKKSSLKQIVDFLRLFKKWSDRIEADKEVTIYHVWPTFMQMNEHLSVSIYIDDDEDLDFRIIEDMKSLGRAYVSNFFSDIVPNDEQRMAVVLHPKMKKLRKMDINDRENAYNLIDNILRAETQQASSSQQIDTQTHTHTDTQSSQTRNSMTLEDFLDSDGGEIVSNYSPELARYLDEKIREKIEDVRDWWFKNRNRYPMLFKLYLRISAIPASSAPAERTFSIAGAVITDRRSSLLPKSVSNIMMCRNLYRS